MDSQYSESLVGDDYSESSMETHTEDDSSITTEERDENSSEEEQISVTTEDSSEEEIDPWSTLINDAASNVRDQYDDILEALLVEGQRYVNNDMFDQDEAIAAAVDKRKFLLKRLLEQ